MAALVLNSTRVSRLQRGHCVLNLAPAAAAAAGDTNNSVDTMIIGELWQHTNSTDLPRGHAREAESEHTTVEWRNHSCEVRCNNEALIRAEWI